jgi:hypothetical protein
MKKMILLAVVFCLASIASKVCAQSINNRDWKAYFADPINDTLMLHVHSDSSFVTNSKGEVILRTNCILTKDTLTLADYSEGEHSCPDAKGKYKVALSGKTFTLSLIDDHVRDVPALSTESNGPRLGNCCSKLFLMLTTSVPTLMLRYGAYLSC